MFNHRWITGHWLFLRGLTRRLTERKLLSELFIEWYPDQGTFSLALNGSELFNSVAKLVSLLFALFSGASRLEFGVPREFQLFEAPGAECLMIVVAPWAPSPGHVKACSTNVS